jgi:predicted aldo/keto reductase-like oxidoreductase
MMFTSAQYQTSEAKIAEAVGHRRNEFYIVTTTDYRKAKNAARQIDESLKIFKTDYIDIYNIGGVRKPEAVDKVLAPGGAIEALLQAKEEGKIGHIGITLHRPEILEKAIKPGYIESVLFAFNWAIQNALTDILPLCEQYNVDSFAMRPLEVGMLDNYAERNLRFLFCSPLDIVVSGMYSPEIIARNVEVATISPTKSEWNDLLVNARELGSSGCRVCMLCSGWSDPVCPYGIDVEMIMAIYYYRKKYDLSPQAEKRWTETVGAARKCDSCGECEKICPYNLPIVSYIHSAVKELHNSIDRSS